MTAATAMRLPPRRLPKWTHVWRWLTVRPDQKGKLCRIVSRAPDRRVLVEFRDGSRTAAPVARSAVRARFKNPFDFFASAPSR